MPVETETMVSVAAALSRLDACHEGAVDELPHGYTKESLWYSIDQRTVMDFARRVLALMAAL
jgi:hypothetical protein